MQRSNLERRKARPLIAFPGKLEANFRPKSVQEASRQQDAKRRGSSPCNDPPTSSRSGGLAEGQVGTDASGVECAMGGAGGGVSRSGGGGGGEGGDGGGRAHCPPLKRRGALDYSKWDHILGAESMHQDAGDLKA